ncbi:Uu.00g142700.m01.CDS01 [Anthostomella pinea]|uniref:Uu.00g142700.m01.CDS01 n=1 Tax=Anthostomella pinea TaxID=933095 RepID=A0AAI8YLM2_9PEZI|nr:Uu.00g142700.m01.CDS01 [Anthostomella pinea]
MATRTAITQIKKSSVDILHLRCHVRPGASQVREGVTAVNDDTIELCVAAQAHDGKANKAVLEILSEALDIAKSDLQITHGLKTRDKTISVPTACFQHGGARKDVDISLLVREKLLRSEST